MSVGRHFPVELPAPVNPEAAVSAVRPADAAGSALYNIVGVVGPEGTSTGSSYVRV